MKKVLIVTSVRESKTRFNELLIKYFKDKGYCVYVSILLNKNQMQECLDPHIENVVWIPMSFKICPISLTFWQALFKMVHLMRSNSFELMHLDTCLGAFMSRMAAYVSKMPFVIYSARPSLNYYYMTDLKEGIGLLVEKIAQRWTNVLITVNQRDYTVATKQLNTRINNILKINEIEDFDMEIMDMNSSDKYQYRKQLGIDEDDLMIVVASKYGKIENIPQIIMAAAVNIKLGAKIKLVIVGHGHHEMILQEQVQQLDMEEHILFVKEKGNTEDLISCCDVVGAFPSKEYVSDSLIQAMRYSKAMICTKTMCNRDWVIDGVNGFMVEENDITQTAQKLKILYDSPTLRKGFQEANKSLIKRYSLQKYTEDVKQIYEDLLDTGKGIQQLK